VSRPVRAIVALGLEAIESQAIYHALAERLGPDDPDTICLVSPRDPYVCVGYHQAVERELDLDAAHRLGLPVTRRMVGGGAVYLDRGQLFVQWIMHPEHVPLDLATRYAFYVEPLIATHRSFGIPARYRPINDIHVEDRKLGGTGAARIQGAEVLVGSFIRTIDTDALAAVLRVDSAKLRDKVAQAMRTYVTSMERELGSAPPEEAIIGRYLDFAERHLARPVQLGVLSAEEEAAIAAMRARLADEAWILDGGGRRVLGVKIREGAEVLIGRTKAPAGLVRVLLVVAEGRVVDASVEGDFTVVPMEAPVTIASALVGERADPERLAAVAADAVRASVTDAPGLEPEHLVAAVEDAFDLQSEPAS
jgi:lipoate-protein ligase A